MQWNCLLSPASKKFKTHPLTGKLMLTILWDSQEPILETYLEHGRAVAKFNLLRHASDRAEVCHPV
jgi:hypothetical protein